MGVGASAGGLEAFTLLLKHVPVNTGMGFVLVQHLDPAHESALTQILAKATGMPVREAADNLPVEPNHVYIIPPNRNMTIAQGRLKLAPRRQIAGSHRSIDVFFESLAQDQRERAIGVILSGTASDGTLGLEAIKAEGGFTLAQDESAKYDSMPRSAMAAGCIDLVLPPEQIANELARIARHPDVLSGARSPAAEGAEAREEEVEASDTPPVRGRGARRAGEGDGLKKTLLILRNHSGVDFSLYKPSTVQRRITRRMVLSKITGLKAYADFLRGNAKELQALYSDMLISVTGFFRNPEAFETLKRKVFPKLLKQQRDDPLRCWVLGCSTGQEAYSIAMAFMECAEGAARLRKMQVFATDLNDELLDKARAGLYTKNLVQDVAPERLRRFFLEEEGGYRVIKPIREMCVFARQNLLSDPPFSRMDLIACRNLLIYLEPSLQKKVLPTFHYALKPEGFLFLGVSESIGSFANLFEPIDKKLRIYSKKAGLTPAFHLPVSRSHPAAKLPGAAKVEPPEGYRGELNAQREADRVTVNHYAPPGVLINADLEILQFRGPTGPYLEPPKGKASFDVLKMAREGLMLPLRAAITKAKKHNATVRREDVRINQNGHTRTVNIEVTPLKNVKERCYLIVFEPAEKRGLPPGKRSPRPRGQAVSHPDARRIAELETELGETGDYFQALQEQQDAANEELQASSEEVQSANEELQSINEELETSKEELESTNEELTTVNEEAARQNVELNRLNSDLNNLHQSLNQAIVLLGRDLTIRRFTPLAERAFNLLATDLGRPLSGIKHNLDCPDLEELITEVIDTVSVREREVRDKAGRWCSLRVRPYLTLDHNKIDGAVLVLVDIDTLKRSEQDIKAARDDAETILRTAPDPFLVLHADLRVNTANDAFYKTFNVIPVESEGRLIYELGNGQWNIPKLRLLLEDILPRNSSFDNFEITHDFATIGRRTMLLNARKLSDAEGRPARILLGIQDITEILQFQVAVRESQTRYQALVDASAQSVWTADSNGAVVEDSPSWRAFTGQTYEQWKGFGWLDTLHPEDRERVSELWQRAVAQRTPMQTLYRVRHVSGEWRWTAVRAVPVLNPDCSVREWVGMNVDITERKQAEEALRLRNDQFETLLNEAPLGVYVVDSDFRIRQMNPTALPVFGSIPDVIGRDFDEMIHILWHKEYADEIVERFRHTLETGEPYIVPERIEERRDRRVREAYEWQINRIPLPEGRYGVVCYFWDISREVLAREAIAESEGRLRFMAESMPQKIFTAKPSGDIDYFNGQLMEFTGLTFEQIRDWGWLQFIHPDDVEKNMRRWKHSINTGKYFHLEHRFRRKDGKYRWHLSRAHAMRDADGQVLMWIGSSTDIEGQKQTERALKEADRRKDEFLGMLAHELRTPLSAISNVAEILWQQPTSDRETTRLQSMLTHQTRTLTRMVEDLLDISRITSGKIRLEKELIALSPVIGRAVESTRSLLESRRHELIVSEPDSPLRIEADAARLEQILVNLLSNAAKYTDPGGRIHLIAKEENGGMCLMVRDNGIGISAEMLSRVFEMFTQVDQSLERTHGGLGIGLALVRSLVEQHGGTIEAESAGTGQGSKFIVRLPLGTMPQQDQGARGVAPVQPAIGPARRILVVEDNQDAAESLAALLELLGHAVRSVHDGASALETAAAFRPDVVLLDIGLPDINGYEVAPRLRQQPGLERIALAALTGWGQEEDRLRARTAGFDHHFVKPIDVDALRAWLASVDPA
ncbi:MAG: PAS domain S-box protein [Pseudomonadota bacterium]|nr:PAS domain S-box protein [Pseudomonadota bacterium]